ncbi:MAG: ATP synthase F0 subunit A [Deltaproteobacteria bacterium]|nr:MAG: ATP synthase F0 subunit A [Deltaproteobacteria bacterium]
MIFAAGFTWWHLLGIADFHAHGHAFITSWLVAAIVIGFAVLGRLALNKAKARQGVAKWYTSPGLGVLTVAELLISFWRALSGGNLSKADTRTFVPLLTGVFFYVFLCNASGMIPGFLPPTEIVHHNWAMSICVFFLFVTVGLLRDPKNFIMHILGPVWFLWWLIPFIELLGLFVRPATLTIRLTGNMFGDHTVLTTMAGLLPWGVPVPFLLLALIVSFIQAFIFTLLTVIYIALSVPHDDH